MQSPASFPASGLLPAVLLTAGLLVLPVRAAGVPSQGHGERGIASEDGVFEPHWHLHSGTANHLFADGHVRSITAEACQHRIDSGDHPARPTA